LRPPNVLANWETDPAVSAVQVPIYVIIRIINVVTYVLYVLILIRVIFSWVRPRRPHPLLLRIERLAFAVTEPLLRPIRNLLYRFQSGSPIDFSPLILYLLIELGANLLTRALLTYF